ncbi:MAG TPA: class I SAM-dependent rRNA methyltransferase [Taishania sp.]|nr:class I SAM-dependent rRNA methyltransferase [Taishania sp.]
MSKIIQLYPKKTQSIERRHPWIFSGAIDLASEGLEDGDLVTVQDKNGKFLAKGHFQNATIAVRVLSFEDIAIDEVFYTSKIESAFRVRVSLGLFSETNQIARLIHGEGDGLPGLIVDFYNGVAVVQCHSIGMYRDITLIAKALQTVMGDKLIAIYSKSSETLPDRVEVKDGYLFGSCETPHVALEHGVKLNIDWIKGQKTGFFIDQRENRLLLGKYARGKKVLNTFCYSGGFSLLALQNGATLVHSLDSSKKAIELTDENVKLNGFTNHQSIVADTMEYIKELPESYDIIILDPPAFAKHRDKRHKAVQGYKRLNAHAIRQIKPGGIIFTFSCSQVIDKVLFTNTVIAASIEAGRNVRILEQLHQPADHPISAVHPEGEYLKGLVIYVD